VYKTATTTTTTTMDKIINRWYSPTTIYTSRAAAAISHMMINDKLGFLTTVREQD